MYTSYEIIMWSLYYKLMIDFRLDSSEQLQAKAKSGTF